MLLPSITRIHQFDYAHRLMKHPGKCASYHGHRGVAEVSVVSSIIDTEQGMLVDFGRVKEIACGWIDKYWDHGMILQKGDPMIPLLVEQQSKHYVIEGPPTVENLVMLLTHRLDSEFALHEDTKKLTVRRVRLYETASCYADYPSV